MSWPKGKPRTGYVKKDGTPHLAKGKKIVRSSKPVKFIRVTADDEYMNPEKPKKEIHGATGKPVIEPCPNCSYAYADGGYCSECNWSLPMPRFM